MASEFDDIRADLLSQKEESSSGQTLFLFMLVAVLAIGGVIGYLVLPRDAGVSNANVASVSQAAGTTATPVKKYKKSELRKMRRVEMRKFRETQAELRNCTTSPGRTSAIFTSYTNRNQPAYNAWQALYDPSKAMVGANALESSAFVLTGGAQRNAQEMFKDIEVELNAHGRAVDPIKCGQLNAEVQRRQRDLPMPPSVD